jgi:predicted TIM-barrel fold metal-dependent hydrolase
MEDRREAIRQELLTFLQTQPVLDTHEHLPPFGNQLDPSLDFLGEYLWHYASSDLQSAGMTDAQLARVRDPAVPFDERWALCEPFWEATQDTTYFRTLRIATRELYGIEEWNRETLPELDARFRLAMADPAHRQKVLREKCGIRLSILDFWEDDMKVDREYYRPVWQANRFILSKPSVQLSPTLDGHLDACTDMYQRNLRDGMIALKCALAYDRTIRFAVVPPAEARAAYAAAAATGFAAGLPTPVQDFVFPHLLGLANRDGLPVQIHTGLLEGMRHPLRQSDPLLLDPLFGRYPGIPFDLFHIGYPWFRESLVLAKSHPNVHLDLCWSHIVAPQAARIALREFLEAVPVSKIFAFGGDYILVDGVLGHLHIARENAAAVLADCVADREITLSRAYRILAMIFHDNAARVFSI